MTKALATAMVVGVMSIVGCGGDGGTKDQLEGTWVVPASSASSCALQADFHSGAYELDLLCPLTNGGAGIQVESGTYTTSGNAYTTVATKSTCQGVQPVTKTETGNYSRQGTSLTATIGTTVLQLQLATAPPSSTGSGTLGCFDDQGNFTANPITAVP